MTKAQKRFINASLILYAVLVLTNKDKYFREFCLAAKGVIKEMKK